MKRRSFLQMSGMAATVPLLGSKAIVSAQASQSATGQILICLFLRGGADGLNIVAPVGDSDYAALRPTIGVPIPGSSADAGLDLDGFFALNPAMAPLLKHYDSGDLAFIQAAGLLNSSHSHFDAQDLMDRGVISFSAAFDGWLNRYLALDSTFDDTFRAIGIGHSTPKSLAGASPTISINKIADFGLTLGEELGPVMQNVLTGLFNKGTLLDQQAQGALSAIDTLVEVDPGQYLPENGAEYPQSEFGGQMLELGQLIKSGLAMEVACIDFHGWDHHNNENQVLPGMLDDLAASLDAFMTDMGARMQDITMVAMSEFGRRAYENASSGTDHGHGNFMFTLGGGVKGGQVYGNWPGLSNTQLVFNGDLDATTDYRTVLTELLGSRFGVNDPDGLFPDYIQQQPLEIFTSI
jgi:uncharacterized protein (DUF1501 family)